MSSARLVVVTDATVIINLCHASLLDVFGRLPGFAFAVTDDVRAEIVQPAQREALEDAARAGIVDWASLASADELRIYAELKTILGAGEASCLALAEQRGLLIASDERRVFLREATARLGAGRIITTPGLLVLAIRANILTIEAADAAKDVLEAHRFKMAFASFADVRDD